MFERLFTPRKGERGPLAEIIVERIGDSGGGWYRPPFRTQNPAIDPQEPYGSESANTGTDHGWANCTMASGAMVLSFHTLGKTDKWGGHLRHAQSDLEGGTDLYDLKDAWLEYGQTLSIRSGNGWDGLESDRAAGMAMVLQGEGGTPGAGTFTGGHAIAVLPETHSDGRWLIGNPECSGFEWVSPKQLREWAQAWSANVSWASSAAHKPGVEMPGIQLRMTGSFSGTATVRGDDHLYGVIATGEAKPIGNGIEKQVFAKAQLDAPWLGKPVGTPVVIIGDDAAILLEADVELSDNSSGEFVPLPELFIRKT